MRDLAHVYSDLVEAQKAMEAARTYAEFLSAQARWEQVEAEWIEQGAARGLPDVHLKG